LRAVALALLIFASVAAASEPAVETHAEGDRVGRVLAELGGALLGAALPNLLWVPFAFAPSNSAAFPVMFVAAMALEPVSIATGTWLVHKRMRGQGLWPAAFGGTMLGAAVGGLLFGLYGGLSGFNLPMHYTVIAGGAAILVTAATSVLMIEVHHDRTVDATVAPVP
jgi:hypothetical protein